MKFDLEQDEAQFIINQLGELPIKTGASMLYQKMTIQLQANLQPKLPAVPDPS